MTRVTLVRVCLPDPRVQSDTERKRKKKEARRARKAAAAGTVVDAAPVVEAVVVEEAAPAAPPPAVAPIADDAWEGLGASPADLAQEFEYDGAVREVKAAAVPADAFVLDVGSETREAWAERVNTAVVISTVVLYGPLGVVETPDCQGGTRDVMEAMATATKVRGITTVVAGGSAAVWARSFGLADAVSFVSAGGPGVASLLAGKPTPGVAVLSAV